MAVMGKVGVSGAWSNSKVLIGKLKPEEVWKMVEKPLLDQLIVKNTEDLRFAPPWMMLMTTPNVPDHIWAPGKPAKKFIDLGIRAVEKLAIPDTPVFTLTYKNIAAPDNLDELVATLINLEPELVQRRDEAQKAEAVLWFDEQEAQGIFQKIVDRQAEGTYGEKLMSLVAAGYAIVEAPHRRVASYWEKGGHLTEKKFGLSRKISGRIPDRFNTKLVVHTHNSYTGGVISASIKDQVGEDQPGGNRMIEERYRQCFKHLDYDNWQKASKLKDTV